ncbi:MAG: YjdF family protein [Enterococcus malodoratus]|uniref:YjdF family protein n=1 Tax=Enterococcus malodoratus TaxID=71451 RepID=UPI0020745053|nr:YjdF family protein [Enterococcus malodoratus]
MKLTIYFDGSFWCGLVEAESDGHYQVIRYVFGAEPKDADVLEFIANCLPRLLEQSGTVAAERKSEKKMNPKRIQRLINREKRQPVVSTKAQLAISELREQAKTASKVQKRQKKADYAEARFQQKQAKKREKHKGH